MAVADEAKGWMEAQRRIAACRDTRNESLDLSDLGLTRIPEEVRKLDWLRQLKLQGDWRRGRIGYDGVRELSSLINLTWLNLSRNRIGAEGGGRCLASSTLLG